MLPLGVWGLALGQALLITGNILLISINALIGQQLTPLPSLATLPVALQFIGLMAVTLPAALLMRTLGRKAGFLIGNVVGVCGAGLCCFALFQSNFYIFCLGTTMLGMAIGVSQQYRFAAIELCSDRERSRAIALIMGAGVIAAVLGPNLAVWASHLHFSQAFAGSFFVVMLLYVLTAVVIANIKLPHANIADTQDSGRSLRELFSQPNLMTAVVAGAIGYGVMVLVMTATPIAMHDHHHPFDQTASVIQWHVLGMFLPSFVTGRLVAKWGEIPLILTGCLLLALCALIGQLGSQYWHYVSALIALGIGWNFTFISATSLLASCYRSSEKAKVQGINDFLVFGSSALASLMAGQLQWWLGWKQLNLVALAAILIAVAVVLRSRRGSALEAAVGE